MVKSQADRSLFTTLFLQGMHLDAIRANLLPNISKRTLQQWTKDLHEKGNLTPKKSTGRPPILGNRDKRHLFRVVRQNPELTIDQAREMSGLSVCHETIVKALKEIGVESVVSAKVPLLTSAHIIKRLRFCNDHLDMTVEDWKSWTFSDECSVELDCAEGIKRYLIRPDQRYELEFVTGKRQGGGGKIMIWSRISYDGVGPLVFVEGGIDSAKYIKILKDYVLDHCLDRIGDDGALHTFQDDGASCHDSNAVIDFCTAKGIQRPLWPPNSPDINPIEHLWGWLKQRLTKLDSKPRTIAQLKVILHRFWAEITLEQIQNYYHSMPQRMKDLKDVNGHNIK